MGRMMMSVVLNIALLAVLTLLALIVVLYFTRGTGIRSVRVLGEEGHLDASDPMFRKSFEHYTATKMRGGSHVELLFNGEEVFPRLFDQLAKATTSITFHVFWFKPGHLADRVLEVLTDRARNGVSVFFLRDWFGSRGIGDDYDAALRAAGAEVAVFRPLRPGTLYKFQQRMHVRSVVIDGAIGFTGGFGIDDRWQGGGRQPGEWRDTNAMIRGEIVEDLQAAFAMNWAEATGDLVTGRALFPVDDDDDVRGSHDAGLIHTAPSLGTTHGERFFVVLITGARKRLYITNAYFLPDSEFRRFLLDAAKRGVDVRVLTPGANTDRKSTWYGARAHYEQLLTGGVRIFEYVPTMVHAKTIVVDGRWCAVSTINFDNRSMMLNDEVGLVVNDSGVAQQMEDAFLADLNHAEEVSLERVRGRGALEKVKERIALVGAPLL